MSQTCVPPRIILKTWLIFNSIKDFQALVHNLKDSSYLKEKKSAVGCEASYQHPKGISFLNSESLRNKIHTFRVRAPFKQMILNFFFIFSFYVCEMAQKKHQKESFSHQTRSVFFTLNIFRGFRV